MNEAEKAMAFPKDDAGAGGNGNIPKFTPVPRRTRNADGWTEERQRGFITALAATGSVRRAAEAAGMSYASAYQLRKARGATSFVKAWDTAISTGVSHIYDTLLDHSLNGVPEPIFYAGKEVGERRRFNHKTMTWMIDNRRQGWHAKGAGAGRGFGRAAGDIDPAEAARLRAEIKARLDRLHDGLLREAQARRAEIAADPDKRAAYEALNGPHDWDAPLTNLLAWKAS
jgi:hypothetical protein